MFVNNNDMPWYAPRDYGPFSPREYRPVKPLGWDTSSWDKLKRSMEKNPKLPEKEKYFFDGKTFTSYEEFQAYVAQKKKERDIKESKQKAILERLKDPYEEGVNNEIYCNCLNTLHLFAIPYELTRDGKIYQGHIYMEFCIHCDDFEARCKEGRKTYLAIAAAELDSKKEKI